MIKPQNFLTKEIPYSASSKNTDNIYQCFLVTSGAQTSLFATREEANVSTPSRSWIPGLPLISGQEFGMVERRPMGSKGISKSGGTIGSTPEDLVVSLLGMAV